MSDYRASANRLRETEANRDKYKNQYDTALRELAQRAERIIQLEQQHKEATERSKHMSLQVSRLSYHNQRLQEENQSLLTQLQATFSSSQVD